MSNEVGYLFREQRYNAWTIAEEVIWPTIDRLSLRDWRKDSEPGMEDVSFPDRGILQGSLVSVCVNASCFIVDGDAGSEDTVLRTASFEVKRQLSLEARDFFLRRAYYERKRPPSLGYHAVRASTVAMYTFTSEDDFDRVEYALLEDDEGGRLGTFQDHNPGQGDETALHTFYDHDLDILAIGLQVLRGSQQQLAALAAMR